MIQDQLGPGWLGKIRGDFFRVGLGPCLSTILWYGYSGSIAEGPFL